MNCLCSDGFLEINGTCYVVSGITFKLYPLMQNMDLCAQLKQIALEYWGTLLCAEICCVSAL